MKNITCKRCNTQNLDNARYCGACGQELEKPVINFLDNIPEAPATSRKRRLIGVAVGTLASSLSYVAVQKIFFAPPSFDKVMVAAASEINKNCPLMVDKYTRLDNVLAMPGNQLQYNYTLVQTAKADIVIDTVKKYIEPGILNNVKTSPTLKIYREHKATLVYYYRDKNGEFVWKYAVTPDMYRQ